jgi:tetratricopeptide (TPR) repeat protein
MREIEQRLPEEQSAASRRRVVVVHGLGGIGKTQLVAEFAREHHESFSSVFWLDGSSEASVKQSFARIFQRLPQNGLTADGVEMVKQPAIDVDVAVRVCLRWLSLSSNRHWLLIFDNVDRDYKDKGDSQAYDLEKYLPPADHGSILVTSRLADLQRGIKVGTVDAEQARAMLENNAGRVIESKSASLTEDAVTDVRRVDVDIVLKRLYGLPLALTQAGAYIGHTNISTSTYAKYYDSTWKRLMDKHEQFPLEEYGDRSVLTTWAISYEQVRKQSEAAASLLKLWGFLDPGDLWYGLVAVDSKLLEILAAPMWLRTLAENELEYHEATGLLTRYSLVDRKEGTNGHTMHLVLHKWCSLLTEGDERHNLGCVAAGLITSNLPRPSGVDYYNQHRRLLAHAIRIYQWIVKERLSDDEDSAVSSIPVMVFHNLGWIFNTADRLREAEFLFNTAFQINKETIGIGSVVLLQDLTSLATVYNEQGRLKEAEAMLEQALEGFREAKGAEDGWTLYTARELAHIYRRQERLKEAETLIKQVLQGYKNTLGAENPATLFAVRLLGEIYMGQGNLRGAEDMFCLALQGFEKIMGAEHMDIYCTMSMLAEVHAEQRHLDKAEAMSKQALQGLEKTAGAEDVVTLNAMHIVGRVYHNQGRLEKAKDMYESALQGYKNNFGPQDISTYTPALVVMHNLAIVHKRQGRLEDARALYSEALSGYEKVFENDHPGCQAIRNYLADLDVAQGKITAPNEGGLMQDFTQMQISFSGSELQGKTSTSRRHRFLGKLGWKPRRG